MNKEQIEKLKEVALRAPKNPGEWPFYLRSFQAAASPEVVLELIALAEHSLSAQDEVLTDEKIDEIAKPYFDKFIVYGDFRRFARSILSATGRTPTEALERIALLEQQREELGQEVRDLITALAFWMPKVDGTEGPLAERVFKDCFLLAGIDGNLPDDFKTAQELGWIAVAPSPAVAVDDDPIGDMQAEARQEKLDDFIASMKPNPASDNKRLVFMDEIDAAKAGSEWLQQFFTPNFSLCFSIDEGARAPRAKWCMLFDSFDRVVAGYMLTRNAKNWTELTKINAATPSPSLAVREKPNADCSGDPMNCPDNEGYGCACSTSGLPG